MFPFLLFVTALVSIFLYQRTNQEIYLVLSVSSAIICLLWGLAIAHWAIHLVSLLALLFLRTPVLKTVEIYEDK
jgi:multidrug efflux pump subunit AcrB